MKGFNFKIVLSFLGLTSVLNGLFMFLSVPVGLYYGEKHFLPILAAGGLTVSIGLLLWYFNRNAPKRILKKEGFSIVTFGWVMLTLTGALPYIFSGAIAHPLDAIFESVSGYTTTGATILTDIEALPKSILFWRSSTHWIGGMGIIVLTIAILPFLGIGGMQLFMAEAPGPSADKIHPRITGTAKRLWAIYIGFTLTETVLLKWAGMGWYDAVNHAMSTMSTGGFSTKNASVAYWNANPWVEYIIILFMFIAGTNFVMSYYAIKLDFRKVWQNEEFRYYAGLIAGSTLLLSFYVYYTSGIAGGGTEHPMVWGRAEAHFRHVLFQVLTVITTTGFVTSDYLHWSPFVITFIFALFFIGGSAGSTAGGVKIVRHLIMLKNALLEFKKQLHPKAIIPLFYNKTRVPEKIVYNILSFFVLYISIFITGAVLFNLMGLDINTSLGAAISSLGNVGPAFGKLGPVDNYAWLSYPAKMLSAFLMIVGRLEIFTVIVLLTPFFWRKN
jgi:trk system potassium uptake protein TrkH